MKLLVCISKTPDTTSKIAFTEGNTKFDENGVQWIINPYDEWYALVRALELKETLGGTVTTISVGGADYEPIIRKAFAIGADDGVRIDLVANDASVVAEQIAAYAQDKGFDLILCGKETIDYNGSQVGSLLSAALDLPYISLATRLTINGTLAEVDREIEGGKEICEVNLPALISCQKGMAEARIPNMKGIMGARTKPLKAVEPVAADALTSVASFELPPAKAGVKLVDAENAGELIKLLHDEAKVI